MGLGDEAPVTSRGGIPVSSFNVRVFATRALADSYREELVRAARTGLAFAPGPGSLSRGPYLSRSR
jgi:hypothetical protein